MQYQPELMGLLQQRSRGAGLRCPLVSRTYDRDAPMKPLSLLLQPHGLSPQENVIKECEEEASIPRELAQLAVPAGAVSYCSEQAEGLKRDVLFCYDLELPQDFVPEPQVFRHLHLCLSWAALEVRSLHITCCESAVSNCTPCQDVSPEPNAADIETIIHCMGSRLLVRCDSAYDKLLRQCQRMCCHVQDGEVESFRRLPFRRM